MKPVRTVFKLVGTVWLIAILAIGLGGTYLERHPEAAAAYALGTMRVDPEAGVIQQAGQLARGVELAREGLDEARALQKYRADKRSSSEARRKYAEARAAGYGHEAAARSAGLPVESTDSFSIE